jgi:leucyl-tRNA synthetase
LNEECGVVLVDQWYLKYREKEYKDFCLNHVKSNKCNAYSPSTLKAFEQVLGWLSNWGVTRIFGLGSRISWDKKFLIESQSDSIIMVNCASKEQNNIFYGLDN